MKKAALFVGGMILLAGAGAWAAEKEAKLNVTGMFCGDCVEKVKGALEKTSGVLSADVSLDDNAATVKFDDSKTNPAQLADVVTDSGFETTVAPE